MSSSDVPRLVSKSILNHINSNSRVFNNPKKKQERVTIYTDGSFFQTDDYLVGGCSVIFAPPFSHLDTRLPVPWPSTSKPLGSSSSSSGSSSSSSSSSEKSASYTSLRAEIYALVTAAKMIRNTAELRMRGPHQFYMLYTDCGYAKNYLMCVCRMQLCPSRFRSESVELYTEFIKKQSELLHPLQPFDYIYRDFLLYADLFDEWWFWTRNVCVEVDWVPAHENNTSGVAQRMIASNFSSGVTVDKHGKKRINMELMQQHYTYNKKSDYWARAAASGVCGGYYKDGSSPNPPHYLRSSGSSSSSYSLSLSSPSSPFLSSPYYSGSSSSSSLSSAAPASLSSSSSSSSSSSEVFDLDVYLLPLRIDTKKNTMSFSSSSSSFSTSASSSLSLSSS